MLLTQCVSPSGLIFYRSKRFDNKRNVIYGGLRPPSLFRLSHAISPKSAEKNTESETAKRFYGNAAVKEYIFWRRYYPMVYTPAHESYPAGAENHQMRAVQPDRSVILYTRIALQNRIHEPFMSWNRPQSYWHVLLLCFDLQGYK